jgi:3-keto-5-aminohexanoate cleavage enzyme
VYWRYADANAYLERVGKMPPVIICCSCNGGIQGKEANDNLPESADEIADSVFGAYQAGATMVHVHARHPENYTRPAVKTEHWLEGQQQDQGALSPTSSSTTPRAAART